MFIVGDNILEALLCDKCKKYLSVKPIKVYPNRGIQCGRCSSDSDAGVVSLFGVLAKEALFRCVNRFAGCNQLLTYSQVAEHEKLCKAAEHICPECIRPFTSSSFGIFVHYKEIHSELLIQNTQEFVLELETDLKITYLVRKNDLLFFLNIKFDFNEEQLTVYTLYLGTGKEFSNISQDFTLFSLDRKVKYGSIKDKEVSGICNTLDPIKISIKIGDICKKVVICKLIINTEKIEKLLVLPKGKDKQEIGAWPAGLKWGKSGVTKPNPKPKVKEVAKPPGFKFENAEGGVQNMTYTYTGPVFSFQNAQGNINSGIQTSKDAVASFPFQIPDKENQLKLTSKSRNDVLVDQLVAEKFITNPSIEKAFRAVDRGIFASEAQEDIYQNKPWQSGDLHQSAPNIYAVALEALNLKHGDRFLNIGSGTGYLSTIAGVLLGPPRSLFTSTENIGLERNSELVEHAAEKFKKWKADNFADTQLQIHNICSPVFYTDNCLVKTHKGSLGLILKEFDKVYCGAACPRLYKSKIFRYLKVGGILVIPIGNQLLKMERLTETEWKNSTLLQVSFAPLIEPDTEVKDEVVAESAEQLKAVESTNTAKQLTDTNSISIKTDTNDDTTEAASSIQQQCDGFLANNVFSTPPIAPFIHKRTPTIIKPLVTPIKTEKSGVGIKNEVAKSSPQEQAEALAKPDDKKLIGNNLLATPIKTKPFLDDKAGVRIKNEVAKSSPEQQAEALAKPDGKKLIGNNLLATPIKTKPFLDDKTGVRITNEVAKSSPKQQAEALAKPDGKKLIGNNLLATPIKTKPFLDDKTGVRIKNEVAKYSPQKQAEALSKPDDKKLIGNSLLATPIKTEPFLDDKTVKFEPQFSFTTPSISNGFTCPECGRVITSQIGMCSHRHHTHGVGSPQIKDCLSPSRNFVAWTPAPTFESYSYSPTISTGRSSSRGSGGGGGSSCPECGRYISSSIGMWSHRHHTHGAV